MREIQGNIWDFHRKGNWVVITTNGFVKKNGECVMGRGIAQEAKALFPKLPRELGEQLSAEGNHLFMFTEYRLLTLPVKHNWWEQADIKLIETSLKELAEFPDLFPEYQPIFLVRPGCGNGKLRWEDVKPICEKYLDDRFVVVDNTISAIEAIDNLFAHKIPVDIDSGTCHNE